jgi:hypothetical protein
MSPQTHLNTARIFVNLMDNQFKIGKYSFGLDPILGLVPGVGDIASFALSFYIIWIGILLKLPPAKLLNMIANILYDFFVGVIPLIGDVLDFTFKANSKNLEIIEKHLAV